MTNITIFIDNKESWIWKFIDSFHDELSNAYIVNIISDKDKLIKGDILFLLGCTKILNAKYLKYHDYNLVIHESALPLGKGFSPLSWQVIEGKSCIPITLFEASEKVDSGVIYCQDNIILDGTELYWELKKKQWEMTMVLINEFLQMYPNVKGSEQSGESSYYRKRTMADDEISVNKSISQIFNELRVKDNENFPAYFYLKGVKYNIKIEKYS